MSDKIIRDPLYNYISIDRNRDGWLIDLLDAKEMQRLRRIHQLGVSHFTYPSAEHNRLAHSLGVLHLMFQSLSHMRKIKDDEQLNQARAPLLAAALVHDVGHGPFSHLFEPCLGIDHEYWSLQIVRDPESEVHQALKKVSNSLPESVASIIDPTNSDHAPWVNSLLSSQLDMDRLDYLRRDSLFTGAGYGHYDYFRILNSFEIYEGEDDDGSIVWPEKSMLAIEKYIFSRYYMYQNVYLHKTTRGFEKLVEAMWNRARELHGNGDELRLHPPIKRLWSGDSCSSSEYLAIEEFSVLSQIQSWSEHVDRPLSDLARRFLGRKRFQMVAPPVIEPGLAGDYSEWEESLRALVSSHAEFDPPEVYCLKDAVKGKYNQPYIPEKETDEQSVKNAIRVLINGRPVEISSVMERLKPVTQVPIERVLYYVPEEVYGAAIKLRNDMTQK